MREHLAVPFDHGSLPADDRLPLAEATRATRGEQIGRWPSGPVGTVESDLARLRPGDVFVALPGPDLDGHELVPIAAIRGAGGAIVSRAWLPRVHEIPLPLLAVDDPATALVEMARARRRRMAARVIGVTGSVGKTSAKEAIAAIARSVYVTDRSRGNRNDQIGLPLSILGLAANCEVVVLEMAGGHGPDEIRTLADIARPHVGLVTNVHPVHLEAMGTVAAIARSKAALVESLDDDGIAVLNLDDPLVAAMRERAGCEVLTFGRSPSADVRLERFDVEGLDGCRGVLRTADERHEFRLPLVGRHAGDVTLAAAAVGVAIGVPLAAVERGVAAAASLVRPRLRRRPDGVVVIDDSYSSSPPAARSALELLSGVRGRRIAIMGDMLELGTMAESAHREIGELAGHCADVVVTMGELATGIAAAATEHGAEVHALGSDDIDGAVAIVDRSRLCAGDAVLVKASRALRLERLVDRLVERPV